MNIFRTLMQVTTIFLLALIMLLTSSLSKEIPKEAEDAAQVFLYKWIESGERNIQFYKRMYGIDNVANLRLARLGQPYRVYETGYKQLLNIEDINNISSFAHFSYFAFPIVINKDVIGVIEVYVDQRGEVVGGGRGGAHPLSDIDSTIISMINNKEHVDPAEIYALYIEYSYKYIVRFEDNLLYIHPINNQAARIVSMRENEYNEYPFILIKNVLPSLKTYAAERQAQEQKINDWNKQRIENPKKMNMD